MPSPSAALTEGPLPLNPYRLVAIGGSAGAIDPLQTLLGALPADFPIPIVVIQHLSASLGSRLPTVLGFRTALRCRWSEEGDLPQAGSVHVAKPGANLILGHDLRFRQISGPKPRMGWPNVDVFLNSMASALGPACIAIVLSGMLYDGADGIAAVRRHGGATIVQHPGTAAFPEMPGAAVDLGRADLMMPLATMIEALTILAEQGIQ